MMEPLSSPRAVPLFFAPIAKGAHPMDAKQKHIVAHAVKMNRIERGLSEAELAGMAGLSVEDLIAIESEEYPLTGVQVNAIADALGIANWVLMV